MKLNSQLLADGDAVALLQRIQELRQELPGGSRRLPGWSWQAVGDLAHRHGIWRTAKFFRFKCKGSAIPSISVSFDQGS